MKFNVNIATDDLSQVPALARTAEEIGVDGLWVPETTHNAYVPLALAAGATSRIQIGSAIAVAFSRSPTTTAHAAWDLAQLSGGRFVLGLGTQVKAHIERRYGMAWEKPGPRLREYIGAVRAVWECWQGGGRLNFRGDHYRLTLMSPMFNPGPIANPAIPITIAGVNPYMCRLAGELCDGFHVHPLNTPLYIRESILPKIKAGAARAGRSLDDVEIMGNVLVVTGANAEEMDASRNMTRLQLAFYASTHSYRPVFEAHGWGDVARQLEVLARGKLWVRMSNLITDEILETVAVVAPWETLAEKVRARYDGLLDRVGFYMPFTPEDGLWRYAVETFKEKSL